MAFWKQAPVNHTIILLNILIFLLTEFTGSWEDVNHMLKWGAAGTLDIMQQHEYYRLFTAMFLHFGIQHLGNNMLVLLFIGDCLERNLGKIRYGLLYLLGGAGANLLSLFHELYSKEYVVSAGASGAVFAVIGGLLYIVIRNKGHIENFSSRQLLILAFLSLYHGLTSTGVNNIAHLGGLLCGFLLGILFYHKRKKPKRSGDR
ncbi:MAG TPA: rhomboid family intramembrane serine protease [Candidatus Blautia merdigallinarum]|uniref:Rhomboid family intramembrane serine protease n=1 Tax=Candidatus Blautia merdigallinarum TaxID=2838495 RepID=A0A9D2N9U6_9FIRM|nr:rhomboid family intramembrane serine protease [Candidatus Blautia merdigallinarum]